MRLPKPRSNNSAGAGVVTGSQHHRELQMPEACKTMTAKGSQSNKEMVGLLNRRGEMLCSVRATLSSVASIRICNDSPLSRIPAQIGYGPAAALGGQKNRAMIGKWGRPLVRLMAMKEWQAVVALCWWECCSHTRHRRHRGISVLVTLCGAKGEHTQCTGKGPSAVVRATILPLLSRASIVQM